MFCFNRSLYSIANSTKPALWVSTSCWMGFSPGGPTSLPGFCLEPTCPVGPHSKYVWLWDLYDRCCSRSALLFQHGVCRSLYINEWARLYSSQTLFLKINGCEILLVGCRLPTPALGACSEPSSVSHCIKFCVFVLLLKHGKLVYIELCLRDT